MKYWKSFLIGLTIALVFFFIPGFATRTYGFLWSEKIISIFPLAKDFFILGLVYTIILTPLYFLYASLDKTQGYSIKTLILFWTGSYLTFLLYLAIGIIGFSKGF